MDGYVKYLNVNNWETSIYVFCYDFRICTLYFWIIQTFLRDIKINTSLSSNSESIPIFTELKKYSIHTSINLQIIIIRVLLIIFFIL